MTATHVPPATTARSEEHFWFTNHVVNPVLRQVLRSPLGRVFGRKLALVDYTGARSGRHRSLIVQYVRDGDDVWIVPAQPSRKTWWRNFRTVHPVTLRLAGTTHVTRALALPAAAVPDGLATYLDAFPHAAKALRLAPDAATPAPVEGVVVVRATVNTR